MNKNIYNSFSLVGNISKINEILEQKNGTKYRYISIAQNNKYIDKSNKVVNNTTFFDVKIFERDYEKFNSLLNIGQYVI